jgi:hypothetical protein
MALSRSWNGEDKGLKNKARKIEKHNVKGDERF